MSGPCGVAAPMMCGQACYVASEPPCWACMCLRGLQRQLGGPYPALVAADTWILCRCTWQRCQGGPARIGPVQLQLVCNVCGGALINGG